MKVLVSTYGCEPGKGSEPGVGWNTVRELSKYHEVWVITCDRDNRPGIEAELVNNPVSNLHFVYYDLPRWARWWHQGQRGVNLHYYLWQIGVYFVARKLNREISFDLVQHVTLVRYWSPSFISLIPVPFIWGPVGGGESMPKAFRQDSSLRGKVYETLRDLARWFGEQDPFVRLTARCSAVALATTEETAVRLRTLGAKRVEVLGACGLSKKDIEFLGDWPSPGDSLVRFASAGRLLHWKGFHLGLRAFALAKIDRAEYWIIGDGPEQERLQALVKELGVAPQVKFWGKLPRDKTLSKLEECHVLVHPSLHDSGGWVCLEAMAAGRPVICLDIGGPATQVTGETGFKIPTHAPDQAVRDLAEAMSHLAHDSKLQMQMGEAGRRRVSEVYDWQIKGQLLNQRYEEVLNWPIGAFSSKPKSS